MIEPLGEPDERQRLARVDRLGGDLVHQRDVFAHRQARDQIVELEHEADMLAPIARQFGIAGADELVLAPRAWPSGRVEPAENVEQRRLAGARRPEQHDEFALIDVEVDVAQRMHRDLAHGIDLAQPARDEDRATGFSLLPGLVRRHDALLLPMRFSERVFKGNASRRTPF